MVGSMSYESAFVPGRRSPQAVLRALVEAGLGEDIFLYEGEGEARIAAGRLARVLVLGDEVWLETADGARRGEPARDPFKQAERLLADLHVPDWTAYGYVAFDLARYYSPYERAFERPLLQLVVPAMEMRFEQGGVHVRAAQGLTRIRGIIGSSGETTAASPSPLHADLSDRGVYEGKVKTVIEAIQRGELQKVILSRRVDVAGRLDLLGTYAAAASVNSAARSYCFQFGDVAGVGFSPELLLRSDRDGNVMTNPLAGTRPRGRSSEEDERLRGELFTDAKEVKEHALSILVAQDEIGSVCRKDSVRVHDFMEVKRYRCVQHLSSRVSGSLAPGNTAWDALRAVFPGVTVSGIDKPTAMRWISRLETEPRGIYGGAVGWIDSRGVADLAIAIRSVYDCAGRVSLRAGAGIVGESVAEREFDESAGKMSTMMSQLVLRPAGTERSEGDDAR